MTALTGTPPTGHARRGTRMPIMSEDERQTLHAALVSLRAANMRLEKINGPGRKPTKLPAVIETFVVCAVMDEALALLEPVSAADPDLYRMVCAMVDASREVARRFALHA